MGSSAQAFRMDTAESNINGVDVAQLKSTIGTVKGSPQLGKFMFRAKNQWLDGAHNRIEINQYYGAGEEHVREKAYTFDADEPPVLSGKDQGPNPVEYVLTALSACMTTSLIYHAAVRGIVIEEVESEFEGDIDLRGFLDLDTSIRRGYQEIRAKFKVRSDASTDVIEELLRKSPVFDVVTNPVPVKIAVEKI